MALTGTKAWPKKFFLIMCHWWIERSSNQQAVLKCSRLVCSLLSPDNFNSQALFYGILCLENYCLCIAICGVSIFWVVFEGGGPYLDILITRLPQGIFTLSAFQCHFLKSIVSFSGQGIFIFSVWKDKTLPVRSISVIRTEPEVFPLTCFSQHLTYQIFEWTFSQWCNSLSRWENHHGETA